MCDKEWVFTDNKSHQPLSSWLQQQQQQQYNPIIISFLMPVLSWILNQANAQVNFIQNQEN